MNPGYDKPLYLLPFDHRHSYVSGMFKFTPPLSKSQHDRVAASKQVIYEGLLQAVAAGAPREFAGVLVDEEFGASILRGAAAQGLVTAVAVEKSGGEEFEFEYGDAFEQHVERFKPTFAKALVRYNPDADAALNRRQTARLRQLSGFCRRSGPRLMFELLVPATPAQMASAAGSKDTYDSQIRPGLMLRSIQALQDEGVEPDVWKIEGLDRREDCERVVETARRGGRGEVACIVLGRGANQAKVAGWLATAATVPGFIGFAVGRTTFWDAIAGYEANAQAREEAVSTIAQRYLEWVAVFVGRQNFTPAG